MKLSKHRKYVLNLLRDKKLNRSYKKGNRPLDPYREKILDDAIKSKNLEHVFPDRRIDK